MSSQLDELRRVLEELREEQVTSSFDTVLLLLLPITTFLLAYASTRNLPPILSALLLTLALWFGCVLVYFIYGKLVGNYKIRALSWFVFFFGFIGVTTFAVLLWILGAGGLLWIAPPYLLSFFGSSLLIGFALSVRPVRWMKRTMERRLPMRTRRDSTSI